MKTSNRSLAAITVILSIVASSPAWAQGGSRDMSFFITSVGSGKGGNLGGLAGADAHCERLAAAAGAGDKTWAAYLSTQGANAVNARDRIGSGPWYNAKGELIARNVADLHKNDVPINEKTGLDEKGEMIGYARVDAQRIPLPIEQQPEAVEHDILTGSQADGTAVPPGNDATCKNWTSDGEGSAMLGHHDRVSRQPDLSPWNAAHPSRRLQSGGVG